MPIRIKTAKKKIQKRAAVFHEDAPPYRVADNSHAPASGNGNGERFLTDEDIWRMRLSGEILKRRQHFTLIDAFAGAGGKTLGFSKKFGHAFIPIWANDIDEDCVQTYNANFGEHCIGGDILKILDDPHTVIPKADVVIGGPPCQGFSNLNQKKNDGIDPRRELWRGFMELVERSEADVFVMENVPPLLRSYEFLQIVKVAERLGFKVRGHRLCASDYGAPQARWRAFVVGCRFADPSYVFPPKKTHYSPVNGEPERELPGSNERYVTKPSPWRTVRDAIADLPAPKGTGINDAPPPLDLHFGRTPTALSLQRYKVVSKQGMNRFDLQRLAPQLTPGCWIRKKSGGTDLFGRMWWDRPCFTIRTEFFKPEKGRYLHPEQHRPITHREAARLQTFTDDFVFCGSKIEIAKQIGNAVPPVLAARVADVVYALLLRRGK